MNPKSPKEILLNLAAACEDRRLEIEKQRTKTFHTQAVYASYISRDDTLRDLRAVFYDAAMKSTPTQ